MNSKDIVDNNIMIAKFMEVPRSNNLLYMIKEHPYLEIDDCDPRESKDSICYEADDLEYHSSWDWLMPVVEKIESMENINIIISSSICRLKHFCCVNEVDRKTKLESVYEIITNFIKDMNNNDK